jgi:hypothetical protein
MIGAAREFSSYSRLTISKNIQTIDGTTQPIIDKGTVKCTNILTLSNVLHSFFSYESLIYKFYHITTTMYYFV